MKVLSKFTFILTALDKFGDESQLVIQRRFKFVARNDDQYILDALRAMSDFDSQIQSERNITILKTEIP